VTLTTVLTVPVFSMLCNEAFRLRREVFILEQNVPRTKNSMPMISPLSM
jgi:hypothetical protein